MVVMMKTIVWGGSGVTHFILCFEYVVMLTVPLFSINSLVSVLISQISLHPLAPEAKLAFSRIRYINSWCRTNLFCWHLAQSLMNRGQTPNCAEVKKIDLCCHYLKQAPSFADCSDFQLTEKVFVAQFTVLSTRGLWNNTLYEGTVIMAQNRWNVFVLPQEINFTLCDMWKHGFW